MWYSQLGAIGVLFWLIWFPWRVTMSDFIWYRNSWGYNTNVEIEPKPEYHSIFDFIFVYAGFNFAIFDSKPCDFLQIKRDSKNHIYEFSYRYISFRTSPIFFLMWSNWCCIRVRWKALWCLDNNCLKVWCYEKDLTWLQWYNIDTDIQI